MAKYMRASDPRQDSILLKLARAEGIEPPANGLAEGCRWRPRPDSNQRHLG
jgi:hypothetical protein